MKHCLSLNLELTVLWLTSWLAVRIPSLCFPYAEIIVWPPCRSACYRFSEDVISSPHAFMATALPVRHLPEPPLSLRLDLDGVSFGTILFEPLHQGFLTQIQRTQAIQSGKQVIFLFFKICLFCILNFNDICKNCSHQSLVLN